MKKLIALLLVGIMLLGGAAMAASWPEGCGPSKPYSKSSPVDLNQTMGYVIIYPTAKLTVNGFCDVLEMYLPREDLQIGAGVLTVYEVVPGMGDQVFCAVNFANPNSVRIRHMNEDELEGVMWGGGMCVDIHLPKSLEFGDRVHSYYVLMEEGCFTAANGAVKSISITAHDAWTPVISGQYGISGLCYVDAPFVPKVLGTPEPTLAPNAGVNNTVTESAVAQPVEEEASNVVHGEEVAPVEGEGQSAEEGVQELPEELEFDLQQNDTPLAGITGESGSDIYAPVVEGLDGQTIESVGVGGLPSSDDGSAGGFVGADDGSTGGFVGADSGAVGFVGADSGAVSGDVGLAPMPTPVPTPAPPTSYTQYVTKPDAGDIVFFDLVMGGDAAYAIPYSENGSVEFETVEFDHSTHVTGTVLKDEVMWGVVFLNAAGDVLQAFELGR